MNAFKKPSTAWLKTNWGIAATKVEATTKALEKAECKIHAATIGCKDLAAELLSDKKEATDAHILYKNKVFNPKFIWGLSLSAFICIGGGTFFHFKNKYDEKKAILLKEENKFYSKDKDDSYIAFVDDEKWIN